MSSHVTFSLIDGPTAAILAQVLPVLLLTLMVEVRRTALHRKFSRLLFGIFFLGFGTVETLLVLSIDGTLYPFRWGDLFSALTIFVLLALIFVISLVDSKR